LLKFGTLVHYVEPGGCTIVEILIAKSKMVDGPKMFNVYVAITRPCIVRFSSYFVQSSITW